MIQLWRILIFTGGIVIILIATIAAVVFIGEAVSQRRQKSVKKRLDAYLSPILKGKPESAQTFIRQSLAFSKGRIEMLQKAKQFLEDPENVKLFLNSVGKRSLKREKLLPYLLELDIQNSHSSMELGDGKVLQFKDGDGVFFYRSGDKKEPALRPDIVSLLNELIQHLHEDGLPLSLRKRLRNFRPKTGLEVSIGSG